MVNAILKILELMSMVQPKFTSLNLTCLFSLIWDTNFKVQWHSLLQDVWIQIKVQGYQNYFQNIL